MLNYNNKFFNLYWLVFLVSFLYVNSSSKSNEVIRTSSIKNLKKLLYSENINKNIDNSKKLENRIALHTAVLGNNFERVRLLLQEGVDIKAKDSMGSNVLFYSSILSDNNCKIKELLGLFYKLTSLLQILNNQENKGLSLRILEQTYQLKNLYFQSKFSFLENQLKDLLADIYFKGYRKIALGYLLNRPELLSDFVKKTLIDLETLTKTLKFQNKFKSRELYFDKKSLNCLLLSYKNAEKLTDKLELYELNKQIKSKRAAFYTLIKKDLPGEIIYSITQEF